MNEQPFYTVPLLLEPVRVRRTYRGGKELDRWHGIADGVDNDQPEEWLASMTEARNPGFPPVENEGLSQVILDGKRHLLRDLVRQEPVAMLGQAHVAHFGPEPGVLAKIIDSAERLSIQVHPDKQFAKERFHSDYGKTECWHILGTRRIDGQEPFLLMGFRPGVTREKWEALYRKQDIPGMVNCLNRIVPKPGQTLLIRGGMPHAIGPGCLLIEIQEPTDYTLRSERTKADGSPIPDALIHQGLGEQALMDCFHYEAMEESVLLAAVCPEEKTERYPGGSCWKLLIGPEDTSCFAMERVEVREPLHFAQGESFSYLVILDGKGALCYSGGNLNVAKTQQIFLPHAMGGFSLCPDGEAPLTVIRCYPPCIRPVSPVI